LKGEIVILEKPDIYLIAGFNEGYLQKSMDYLETMNRYSNVNNIIVTLDFDITPELKIKLNNTKFVRINSEQVKSPNPNKCMQHGAFLEVLGFISDESVIIFTDTDITIQRPFSESQLQLLKSCGDKDVFVNANISEEQTLLMETQGLSLNTDIAEIAKKYPEISEFKGYNTGVFCTRCKTYKQIYQLYNQYWPAFAPLFDTHVKQQILLSYMIQKHFRHRPLPYVIHANACSAPILECSTKKIGYLGETGHSGFKLCIGSEVVVFSHHMRHELVLQVTRLQKKIRVLYKVIVFLAVLIVVLLLIAALK
jgi:hypothetical protein